MADMTKMFNAYNKHLNIIRELGITDSTDDYICPLCLRGFSKDEIKELSLEDAPQEKLGGNKIAITCKHCNNTCGNSIDFHLINFIDFMERKRFLPGTDRKIKILNLGEGKPVEAKLRVSNKDNIELVIPNDYYNSKTYKERLDMITKDAITMVQDKPLVVDFQKVSCAIIKNAYIILFSKTGYAFLLDNYYDRIREYIKNPKSFAFSNGMWKPICDTNCIDGVYLSNHKLCRGFYIIYTLSRKQEFRRIVYIPSPLLDFDDTIAVFHEIKSVEGLLSQRLDSKTLLWEKDEIEALRQWVYTGDN